MHRLKLLCADLGVIALATGLALLLRDNFEFWPARMAALGPYLLLTLAVAAVVFPLLGINRTIWRYTAMTDFLRLVLATILVVLGAVALGFGFNRLEGVPRTLPVLQGLLMLASMAGLRVLARLRHSARKKPGQLVAPQNEGNAEMVLVVGLSRLTELYLRSVAELAPDRVRIAGLLGRSAHHTGRFVHHHRVLGIPEKVTDVLRDLEVHGVLVDRIVVTTAMDRLSKEAQEALLDIERSSAIHVEFLAERMGLDARLPAAPRSARREAPSGADAATFQIGAEALAALAARPYWRIKRLVDIVAALVLLVLTAPLMLLAAVLAAIDVGLPVTFWQQRPGLAGRPFKLYKVRTMAAAHDTKGLPVPDSERLSGIGRFLRRTRLDELPQLLNILIGEMSFIGPRPLLASEQPAAYAARLLVRPGLTGWAQVKGGRDVSAANKAALDLWYVRHASLALDAQILLRTAKMIVWGESMQAAAILQAWRDLQAAGICVADGLEVGRQAMRPTQVKSAA